MRRNSNPLVGSVRVSFASYDEKPAAKVPKTTLPTQRDESVYVVILSSRESALFLTHKLNVSAGKAERKTIPIRHRVHAPPLPLGERSGRFSPSSACRAT